MSVVNELLPALRQDRSLVLIRAEHIDDPAALCGALVAGGIHVVEFAFTTPGVAGILRTAIESGTGAFVGAGTVTNEAQAEEALAAGAAFLVTPGVHEGVAAVANAAGMPVIMGALTPTEVMRALDAGAAAVKIFPASSVGPGHVRQLHGPFPGVPLIASGGITADTAGAWVAAGAIAATAGSGVVSADAIATADWVGISSRARAFRNAAMTQDG